MVCPSLCWAPRWKYRFSEISVLMGKSSLDCPVSVQVMDCFQQYYLKMFPLTIQLKAIINSIIFKAGVFPCFGKILMYLLQWENQHLFCWNQRKWDNMMNFDTVQIFQWHLLSIRFVCSKAENENVYFISNIDFKRSQAEDWNFYTRTHHKRLFCRRWVMPS